MARSEKTEEGVRLVWMQFDRAEILRGKALLEAAAGEGDADAGCFLAMTFLGGDYVWSGSGMETDGARGAALLREAVGRGSACGVTVALRRGELTPGLRSAMPFPSLRNAWEETLLGARDQVLCQYLVGDACYWGDPLRLDGPMEITGEARAAVAAQARPWLEKAVAAGLTRAGFDLVGLYRGEWGDPDPAAERRTVEACAARGDPEWEELLGRYLRDEGKTAEAVEWFWKAAEHGAATGWGCLGEVFLRGDGVGADCGKALECFQKGAEIGDPAAQRSLAWLCFEGTQTPGDAAGAAYWAGRAADAGEGEREYAYPLLAHCLLHGIGTPRNVDDAMDLLHEALKFNLSGGGGYRYPARDCRLLYRDLGEIREKGWEGGATPAKAAESYRLAAEEFGDKESAGRLARFHKGLFGKWKRK